MSDVATHTGTLSRLREEMTQQLELQSTLEDDFAQVMRLKSLMSDQVGQVP